MPTITLFCANDYFVETQESWKEIRSKTFYDILKVFLAIAGSLIYVYHGFLYSCIFTLGINQILPNTSQGPSRSSLCIGLFSEPQPFLNKSIMLHCAAIALLGLLCSPQIMLAVVAFCMLMKPDYFLKIKQDGKIQQDFQYQYAIFPLFLKLSAWRGYSGIVASVASPLFDIFYNLYLGLIPNLSSFLRDRNTCEVISEVKERYKISLKQSPHNVILSVEFPQNVEITTQERQNIVSSCLLARTKLQQQSNSFSSSLKSNIQALSEGTIRAALDRELASNNIAKRNDNSQTQEQPNHQPLLAFKRNTPTPQARQSEALSRSWFCWSR